MIGNIINLDFYSFLEPFAPILDGEEFTQQQVDAFRVILIVFSCKSTSEKLLPTKVHLYLGWKLEHG